MQEEEEHFNEIIKHSKRKLVTLKLLSNFFVHPDLFGVLVKTEIIHNLFENNKVLDINKLELFHVQYTSTFIELFQKLKRQKEQQYLLLTDEIHINEDLISKLKTEISQDHFHEKTKVHARNMSGKIAQLYNLLACNQTEPFHWTEISNFSKSVAAEYYRKISAEDYARISAFDRKMYSNVHALFEKKLLGRLNIYKFQIKFLCGLVCGNDVIEVYEFRDTNDRFIFVDEHNAFYFFSEEDSKGIDLSRNHAAKQEVIKQLEVKNNQLKEQLASIKTSIPESVLEVQKAYLEKISAVDFLNELQNVDEQTNILRAMLNVKIN